jgi:hypothetical protein
MDKFQIPGGNECYTPSSEPFMKLKVLSVEAAHNRKCPLRQFGVEIPWSRYSSVGIAARCLSISGSGERCVYSPPALGPVQASI